MASKQTLEDFAGGYRRPSTMWAESELPDDVKKQILSSNHVGARKVVLWLRSIGFDEATESKIEHFRRRHA
jgi:hypothetical protein